MVLCMMWKCRRYLDMHATKHQQLSCVLVHEPLVVPQVENIYVLVVRVPPILVDMLAMASIKDVIWVGSDHPCRRPNTADLADRSEQAQTSRAKLGMPDVSENCPVKLPCEIACIANPFRLCITGKRTPGAVAGQGRPSHSTGDAFSLLV